MDELKVDDFMNGLIRRTPGESEFHEAVREVAQSVIPFINEHPKYRKARILERMTEPDRTIIFACAGRTIRERYTSTAVTGSSSTTPSARTRVG